MQFCLLKNLLWNHYLLFVFWCFFEVWFSWLCWTENGPMDILVFYWLFLLSLFVFWCCLKCDGLLLKVYPSTRNWWSVWLRMINNVDIVFVFECVCFDAHITFLVTILILKVPALNTTLVLLFLLWMSNFMLLKHYLNVVYEFMTLT